jgi:glycosyltransferase involved in cell wall biosynthesis
LIEKVSVVIPTRNSAETLEQTISSVKGQSYSNIEIVISDSKSNDDTLKIAERMDCKIVSTDWKLLGARYQGFKVSTGDYILMLDSDQVLEKEAIDRSMLLFEEFDMLCLEEMSYRAKTMIEKMFEADRKLIQQDADLQLDPVFGTLLPRFFRRDLLIKAYEAIPKSHFPVVIAQDHAILYYEAWKLSKRIAIVPHSIWHNEPATLRDLWKKNFRYGRSTKTLFELGHYNDFWKRKTRLRKTKKHISRNKVLSSALLLLKAPPYLIGLYF